MKTTKDDRFNAVLVATLVGALMFTALPSHANAAESATCAAATHGFDARLASKADQGYPALRGFVIRNRAIYQMDMNEAVSRVEQQRKVVAACGK